MRAFVRTAKRSERRRLDGHFRACWTALGKRTVRGMSVGLGRFPSKTDTFGQVIIEAMASGLPVAGFPVTGPIDLVVDGCGAVDDDLLTAMTKAS